MPPDLTVKGYAFVRFLRPLTATLCLALSLSAMPAPAQAAAPQEVLSNWYRLVLELVRHTPTYTPPVASRAFAYLGVMSYESVASGRSDMQTLAGQLNGLSPLPAREAGVDFDEAAVLDAALTAGAKALFANTGPTGQRALVAMGRKQEQRVSEGLAPEVMARSAAYGQAVAAHILAWAETDGGADIVNMGFPLDYTLVDKPGQWVPTSKIALQQKPLLPGWGQNRPFAMPTGTPCALPPPPAYSEDPTSAFYAQAKEVYDIKNNLTDEQRMIARYWSDDAMLSNTPPGHWIAIAQQIAARDSLPIERQVDVLARLGVAVADGFVGCWQAKYQYNLLRPITYIRKLIDPKWETLLISPPFPEYPSGHSTQSSAAATVMTAIFGDNFAFSDGSGVDDGLPERSFPSFEAAAHEAALSRLYGGIHFRAAIDRGFEQGACIGAYAVALKTLR